MSTPTLRLLAAMGALAMAGCAGAPTRIHTLEASRPAAPATAPWTRGAFRIDAAHVPPAFDRPELVRRRDGYTVTLSDNDRWAAPLGELVRRALTQDLQQRLPAGVVILPEAPKPPAASGLVIDLLTVHPEGGDTVLDASWTWIAPRTPVTTVTPKGGLSTTTPPPAVLPPRTARLATPTGVPGKSGVEGVAPELSTLLGQLADRIAADAPGG